MKKRLSIVLILMSFVIGLFALPAATHAGECFTGPVYLADFDVEVKAAVFLRDGPCSDSRTNRLEIAGAGTVWKAVARNHGWILIKSEAGAIGWIWEPGRVNRRVTQDRFSAGQYVSTRGYGIGDRHEEFGHLFGNNKNNDNSSSNTSKPIQTQDDTPTFELSSAMKDKLDTVLLKVFLKVREMADTSSARKTVYTQLINSLENIKKEKPSISEILRYIIYKVKIEKENS